MSGRDSLLAYKLAFGLALPAVFGASCSTMETDVTVLSDVKAQPVASVSYYAASLRCMDDLLLARQIRDVVIATDGVIDKTALGELTGRELIVGAISKMARNSGAIKLIDYPENMGSVITLYERIFAGDAATAEARLIPVPQYYLVASLSHREKKAYSVDKKLGFIHKLLAAEWISAQSVDIYTMHMHFNEFKAHTTIGRSSVTNRVALMRSSDQAAAAVTKDSTVYDDVGAYISSEVTESKITAGVTAESNENVYSAVQKLFELSLIESISKLFGLPVQTCMSIPALEDIASLRLRFREFQATGKEGLLALLAASQYMPKESESIGEILSRFQMEWDVTPVGMLTFETYLMLLQAAEYNKHKARIP